MLYNEKNENPDKPEVSIADLEDKLNIEGAELDSYIRISHIGDILNMMALKLSKDRILK